MDKGNEKSVKQDNEEELLIQMKSNIATTITKQCHDKSKFPIDKQKDKEQNNLRLIEMEQHFKVEDLERWIEENRRAGEEKRWSAYREQKIKQLDKKRMENEAQWVKKGDMEDEILKRNEDELRQRENIKKTEDERKWAIYGKELIDEMKREEVKAVNKDVDQIFWEENKKQMLNRKESERKCTEENLKSVNEEFAEFEELVQRKRADVDLRENHCCCSISQRIMKEYLTADTRAQKEGWTNYRKLLEGIDREKNMTSAKNITHKTEDLRRLEDKYLAKPSIMVARRVKEDKGACWVQNVCKDVQDEVFSDFEDITEGKGAKVLTEKREKGHYQGLQRQLEEQLKFETKKKGEGSKAKGPRVVELVDDWKWARYRKRLIEEFDREDKLALKAEAERNAEEERWWAEIKKMVAEKDKREKARAGIEEVLAEYQELADCMEK